LFKRASGIEEFIAAEARKALDAVVENCKIYSVWSALSKVDLYKSEIKE
jgi:hypothetical protein